MTVGQGRSCAQEPDSVVLVSDERYPVERQPGPAIGWRRRVMLLPPQYIYCTARFKDSDEASSEYALKHNRISCAEEL